MPKELLEKCFFALVVAHTRGDDYYDNWYDAIDMEDGELRTYWFKPPKVDGNMYVTVESYPNELVPGMCMQGEDPEGFYWGQVEAPMLSLMVSREVNNKMYSYEIQYHMDEYNIPILIKEEDYEAD